ncbi:MAG: T9SS type A sorting domain-containing protein [Candidatus Symbiothrix sp.]|jgi:hypothetical protein|nr:T9SS type A sorting domain-containing protein [Candidatus Symbiothrix sp.]
MKYIKKASLFCLLGALLSVALPAAGTTGNVSPTKDTYVQFNNATTSYGDVNMLIVKYNGSDTHQQSRVALFEFDLAPYAANVSAVQSLKFHFALQYYFNANDPSDMKLNILKINGFTFDESQENNTVQSNYTASGVSSTLLGDVAVEKANFYNVEFQITLDKAQLLAGVSAANSKVVLAIKCSAAGLQYSPFNIHSKEANDASLRPYLIVDTEGGTSDPTDPEDPEDPDIPGIVYGNYLWRPLKVGGGGWVVGLWIHPTERDLMYVRADVSGAYRWDAANQTWKQIVTSTSIPSGFVSYAGYEGVTSICGAPSNPNIAYMAFKNQVFKSVDRGDTWTSTNYYGAGTPTMAPNGVGRQEGERLVVDPNNSEVVYFGSINGGLWASYNGGSGWQKISAIPNGTANHGVNTIVFDKNSGTTNSRTNKIFVTVDGQGVYQSADAGANWTKISTISSPRPRDAELSSDGTYYVCFANEDGATGQVWKYSTAGTWTSITPGGNKNYWDIAVDPTNNQRIMVVCNNGQNAYTSTNGGTTWTSQGSFKLSSNGVEWLAKQTTYWLSVGEIQFDPFDAGKVWFAEGFGVWWTKDLADSQIQWEEASRGIEETCGNTVLSPPGGYPLSAQWDVGVFCHINPDQYNAKRAWPSFMSAWHIDYCAADPSFVAAVFHNHINDKLNTSAYSSDKGQTWTKFASIPTDFEYGCIAVSANSKDNIVYLPANGKLPYYTTNKGSAWTQGSFSGITSSGYTNYPSSRKPLCADRVNASTFYFYHNDGIFRSINSGATWTKMSDSPFPGRANIMMKTVPGRAQDLWIAEGKTVGNPSGGLWHSTDGGATWTQMWTANSGLQQAFSVGFGKAKTADGYPTIFVAGVSNGTHGVWRSTDAGVTWTQICDYPLGIYGFVDDIDGDKDTFGKVYICFGEAGFAYGVESTSTAIQEITSKGIAIDYRDNDLTVRNIQKPTEMRIYNTMGALVCARQSDSDFSINLSGWLSGVFIVSLNDGEQAVSYKIIH